MWKNYLLVALRILRRNRVYAFINVTGLAAGIACCLLIALYVQDELSYDDFHRKADRIYRVTSHDLIDEQHWAPVGPPVGPALSHSVPGIEKAVRFKSVGESVALGTEEKPFEVQDLLYADSTVFDVFTLPFLRGSPDAALSDPYTIVLTEELARRYFGEENPLGQTLTLGDETRLMVTGVMEDLPTATHLPFEALISMPTFYAEAGDWVDETKTWKAFYTYVLLEEGHSAEEVSRRLPAFANRFFPSEDGRPASEKEHLTLQPLTSIHLHSHLEKEWRANSDAAYLWLFSLIALFVLGIACINFMNLATARSAERAKEVGVRKTVGASRQRLVGQFLAESVMLTAFATVGALILAEGALPFFRSLSGKELAGSLPTDPLVLTGLLIGALVVGLLAGGYPAFVLSRFQPARVLKGTFTTSAQGAMLRKGLVVFQFSLTIALVAGTLVVRDQMAYLQTKHLGFDKEHVISVRLGGAVSKKVARQAEMFKTELKQHPAIESAAMASGVPGERFSVEAFRPEDAPERSSTPMRAIYGVDHDYLSTLGIELESGRNFSPARSTDMSNAFILNEAAVKALGLDRPVGKQLIWDSHGDERGTIVGVVKDFHFASLHREIEPLVIPFRPQDAGEYLLVRTQPSKTAEALRILQAEWERLAPGAPFTYVFLDRAFDQLYRAEARLGRVVTVLSVLLVFIACLGLFGLAAFTVQKRTKEIGVRKVLGASTASIALLLSKDFLKLVILASVVAMPVAYYAASRWLQGFAYHTDLRLWSFIGAGALALGVALLTVSYQAIRAALADPVKSLRYE